MIERTNPIGIEATGQVKPDLTPQIKELHERIRQADQDRRDWTKKQQVLIEQRRGIRKPKTVPWVGANNDNWPVTDGVIRRWKPGIISLVLDADPIAYFLAKRPEHIEPARSAQAFWHWKFGKIRDVRRTAFYLADLIAQHGLAYTHEGWDYHIERKCRVVRSEELFPGGVQAALDTVNQQITQANAQLIQAIQAGQADPSTPQTPLMQPDEFVRETLITEYQLGDQGNEMEQVEHATQAILQGAPYVKLYYHCVERDTVAWAAMSPLNVVVPSRCADVEYADFITIVFHMTADEIRAKVRDGVFTNEAAQRVIARMRTSRQGDTTDRDADFDSTTASARTSIQDILDDIDGVETRHSRSEPGTEPIWKVYTRLDIDGDGIRERVILWYHAPTSTTLSITEYPFPFPEWPVTPYEFEHNDKRPYQARGIAEMLTVFQKQVNRLHNARLDAIQIVLSPMFAVRSVGGQINRNIRFRPGQFVPVQSPGDFAPVPHDVSGLYQFLQEENYTKTLAEQYVGVFDSSITDALSPAERRTATEVESINASVTNVFGQDATLFQTSFAKSMGKLWKLWVEFGPPEEYFRVTGEDQPRLARKYEIAHDYDIEPAGTPANTNKALALSRAREMIQLFAPDQTGLINKHYLYKNYFDLTDRELSKLIVRTESDAAAVQQILQAAQVAAGEGAPPFQAF